MVSGNLDTIRNTILELMPLAKLTLLKVFSTGYTFSMDPGNTYIYIHLWIMVIMAGLINLHAFIQIISEPYSDWENTQQNDPHSLLLLFCFFMHQTWIHKCTASTGTCPSCPHRAGLPPQWHTLNCALEIDAEGLLGARGEKLMTA